MSHWQPSSQSLVRLSVFLLKQVEMLSNPPSYHHAAPTAGRSTEYWLVEATKLGSHWSTCTRSVAPARVWFAWKLEQVFSRVTSLAWQRSSLLVNTVTTFVFQFNMLHITITSSFLWKNSISWLWSLKQYNLVTEYSIVWVKQMMMHLEIFPDNDNKSF